MSRLNIMTYLLKRHDALSDILWHDDELRGLLIKPFEIDGIGSLTIIIGVVLVIEFRLLSFLVSLKLRENFGKRGSLFNLAREVVAFMVVLGGAVQGISGVAPLLRTHELRQDGLCIYIYI